MPLLQSNQFDTGYCLRLANDQCWHLIAAQGMKMWIKKLASVMELKTCGPNGFPRLIFIKRKSEKEKWQNPIGRLNKNILKGLPITGWKVYSFKLLRFWSHSKVPDVICEIGPDERHDLDIIRMWQATHPIYERAQNSGGLPLHAALIEREGMGILLAGRGSTGKSTCCRYLPSPWHTFCDDETLIVRNDQKRYLVHPFPTWSDYIWNLSAKTWDVQRFLPLFAIFFLKQAETDEVVPIGHGQASIFINLLAMDVYQQSWNHLDHKDVRAIKKKLFNNSCELAKSIPAFILRVSLSGQFWKEIEKVL